MSQENVDVVRRMYEAFHSGDAETSLGEFDPDVVVDHSVRPDGGIGRGREFLATSIGAWVGTFEDWSEEIDEIRDLDDHGVLVLLTQRGRGKGSGVEVATPYGVLFEVSAGKITSLRLFATREQALAETDQLA
jgi:ketosteroid isomerase-like protein